MTRWAGRALAVIAAVVLILLPWQLSPGDQTLYTQMGEKQLKKRERFRLPGTPQAHARSRDRAWLQTRPENPSLAMVADCLRPFEIDATPGW